MPRRSMVFAVLALVSACRGEASKYDMHCDLLREPGWSALCDRLERAVGLSSGHGQVFGNKHWDCIGSQLDVVYCETPRVSEVLLDEVVSADERRRERETFRERNGRLPSDDEVRPGVEMDPVFARCAAQLQQRFQLAASTPAWAQETCAKHAK